MGAAKEFFHFPWVTTNAIVSGFAPIIKFDGTDGAQSAFVAKNEVNSFVLDVAIGFVAVLVTDFMTK